MITRFGNEGNAPAMRACIYDKNNSATKWEMWELENGMFQVCCIVDDEQISFVTLHDSAAEMVMRVIDAGQGVN